MSAKNPKASESKNIPRGNANSNRKRDEDDHPIEGYRDGSVYEEPGEYDDDSADPPKTMPR